MGQLVSAKRFRGDYEPLANEDDELLETPVESCAITVDGASLRLGSSDDISAISSGDMRNSDDALESGGKPSSSPLSVVATAARMRKKGFSSAIERRDGDFNNTKMLLEPGRQTLVMVTERMKCGNNGSGSTPRARLRRSRSMEW